MHTVYIDNIVVQNSQLTDFVQYYKKIILLIFPATGSLNNVSTAPIFHLLNTYTEHQSS